MSSEFKVFLQCVQGKNPPSWAVGEHQIHIWYYENEHGEQWVAKREKDILRIAGLDIGWQEITLEQAEVEHARIKERRLLLSITQNPDLKEIASAYLETAVARQPSSEKNAAR